MYLARSGGCRIHSMAQQYIDVHINNDELLEKYEGEMVMCIAIHYPKIVTPTTTNQTRFRIDKSANLLTDIYMWQRFR